MVLDESVAMWKQAIGLDGMIWTNGSDLKGMESEMLLFSSACERGC